MNKSILAGVALLAAAFSLSLPAPGDAAEGYRRLRDAGRVRAKSLVWEPEMRVGETATVPGFWRPRTRDGYKWIPMERDEVGRWHSGYWSPLGQEKRVERIILPGYWGPPGRIGYIWIKSADRPDTYPAGDWRRMNSFQLRQTPWKWVPGYWDGRSWIPGYWRIPRREGFIWMEGYWRTDGRRQDGRWEVAPDEK